MSQSGPIGIKRIRVWLGDECLGTFYCNRDRAIELLEDHGYGNLQVVTTHERKYTKVTWVDVYVKRR